MRSYRDFSKSIKDSWISKMSSNYTEELYDLEEIVEFFKFTASKLPHAINLLSLTFEPISYNLRQKTACFHVRSKLGQDLLAQPVVIVASSV